MRRQHTVSEAFEDFIFKCVFIHDDTDSSAGVDWDPHGTNPFLLGPRYCVVDTLVGFGEPYLDYLRDMGILPSTLIIPEHVTDSLTDNLLMDRQQLTELERIVRTNDLHFSVFYSDHKKEQLAATVMDGPYESRIHPSLRAFSIGNDKLRMRSLLENTSVPIPEGAICQSAQDVLHFFDQAQSRFPKILIKKHHWDTVTLGSRSEAEAFGLSPAVEYPVLAEVAYPVRCSPVCHNLVWQGGITHLFTVMQHIRDLRHAGNLTPTEVPNAVLDRMAECCEKIIEHVPGFSGVFGVDFILTKDDQLLAVDVNPRFNSSTYPFFFLQRMGADLETTCARYGFKTCTVPNLSHIFLDDRFVPFDRKRLEGCVIYAPAFDRSNQMVTKVSYLCVAPNHSSLSLLEDRIVSILGTSRPTV